VTLVGYDKTPMVPQKAAEFEKRFGKRFTVADGSTEAGRRAALAEADVVLVAARAGVQVLSADELTSARRLKVAADANAVPPAGIEGLAAKADGAPIGQAAVGIGALAIGNVKFRLQRKLLRRLHEGTQPEFMDFREAFVVARELVAGA
jgi:methylene-tetrahydromethanopterin dehydrogenase